MGWGNRSKSVRSRSAETALALSLLSVGLLLVWPLTGVEYLANWGIIDGTFIALAQRLLDAGGNPGWLAEWYGGTRFDYAYPPAIPYATAALSAAAGWSPARAYHVYTAILYTLGPVSLYFLLRVLGQTRAWAFAGSILWLIASPSFPLLDVYRRDAEAGMPMRLNVLLKYGEGPHGSAVALLPLALALLWLALRRGGVWVPLASLAAALVVAHNFYGALALVLFATPLLCVTLAESRQWCIALRAALVALLAYGWNAPWLSPGYLQLTAENLRLVAQPGQPLPRLGFLILALAIGVLAWRRTFRAASLWVVALVLLLSYWVIGFVWFGWRIVGEPHRFVPELDLALVLGLVFLLGRLPAAWALGAGLAFIAVQEPYLIRCWSIIRADHNWAQRPEYALGQWIHHHHPGSRVQAANSVRLWLNVWHPIPQLSGGSDQGLLNPQTMLAQWQILKDEHGRRAVQWLKAMGADLIIVQHAGSQVVYQDYAHPEVFDRHLELLHDDGAGNRIYATGRRWPVLARVVKTIAIDAVREIPVSHYNHDELRRYVLAVESGPDRPPSFERISPTRLRIRARLEPGEALLVQESYDLQWQAKISGRQVPIERDPAGWMLLRDLSGEVKVEFTWSAPHQMLNGNALFFATLGLSLALFFRRGRIQDPQF